MYNLDKDLVNWFPEFQAIVIKKSTLQTCIGNVPVPDTLTIYGNDLGVVFSYLDKSNMKRPVINDLVGVDSDCVSYAFFPVLCNDNIVLNTLKEENIVFFVVVDL